MNGYLNEITFINYLNNKKYEEINIPMQELLKKLYPNIKNKDKIYAYKYIRYAKADVVIVVRRKKKGISIKSGSKNSVHVEKIEKFVKYLQKYKFKEKDKLLKYLYSDGTINNTGIIRQSAEEYKNNHSDEIKLINEELNKIKRYLIERFLIVSDIKYKVKVDAFIYGYLDDFLWATKEEVIKYLYDIKNESSGVHISNLFIQNWNKNIIKNFKYEYCRNYIQVKWYSIFDDIVKIMCSRR